MFSAFPHTRVRVRTLRKDWNNFANAVRRRSLDYRGPLSSLLGKLEREVHTIFDSNGFFVSPVAMRLPWKPLNPRYQQWKIKNYGHKGILVGRSTTLRDSFTLSHARGAVRRATPDSMEFGSDLSIARIHHFGTDNIPARPMLPHHRAVSFWAGQRIADHIMGAKRFNVPKRFKDL